MQEFPHEEADEVNYVGVLTVILLFMSPSLLSS